MNVEPKRIDSMILLLSTKLVAQVNLHIRLYNVLAALQKTVTETRSPFNIFHCCIKQMVYYLGNAERKNRKLSAKIRSANVNKLVMLRDKNSKKTNYISLWDEIFVGAIILVKCD